MDVLNIESEILQLERLLNIEDKLINLDKIIKELSIIDYANVNFISLNKQKIILEDTISDFQEIKKIYKDIKELEELIANDFDEDISNEINKLKEKIKILILELKIQSIFKKEEDKLNCFLEINAGAGGLDSQDWVLMMARMYTLFFEKKEIKYEIEDKNEGEHANCLKNIRFSVRGKNTFGLLKNETGIHRLVRISPFNAKGKRQTSFAGVFVYPEIDDTINIKIEEKDLIFESCKSSGAGGQHVNKTESAMRVTHLPTGISIKCQTSKSQNQNKELALKNLKSRLYNIELEKKNDKIATILEEKNDISWGNQIRNYVLHPYKMVKDLRSNFSIGNVDKVLNGDLNELINSVLFLQKD